MSKDLAMLFEGGVSVGVPDIIEFDIEQLNESRVKIGKAAFDEADAQVFLPRNGPALHYGLHDVTIEKLLAASMGAAVWLEFDLNALVQHVATDDEQFGRDDTIKIAQHFEKWAKQLRRAAVTKPEYED